MKNASEYARRVKRIINSVKSQGDKAPQPTEDTVTDHLLLAVLMRFANDATALAAYKRLREHTVDLNELRVTPIAEMIDLLGPSFPNSKVAAEAVLRALGAVFNRCHHLDLSFLRKMGRREARTYLETLDGMDPFSAAFVAQRALEHHTVAVDERVLAWLREQNAIPAETTQAEAQALLERVVSPAQAETVVVALRKQSNTRSNRNAAKAAEVQRETAKRAPASGSGNEGSKKTSESKPAPRKSHQRASSRQR